ncbi:MAG: hypothetical protein ACYS32_15195 [Planctomycetota bacterium]
MTGYFGGALDFDGSDDYVEIGYSSALSLNDFTVSAWVNIATEPGQGSAWAVGVVAVSRPPNSMAKTTFLFMRFRTPFEPNALRTAESVTVRAKYLKQLFQSRYYADGYPKCFIS